MIVGLMGGVLLFMKSNMYFIHFLIFHLFIIIFVFFLDSNHLIFFFFEEPARIYVVWIVIGIHSLPSSWRE
jgi:hypothetical protein